MWARPIPSESGEYEALVCKASTQACIREGVFLTQGSKSSIVDNLGKESAEPLSRGDYREEKATSSYDSQSGALDNHGRKVQCTGWADARCRATLDVNISNVMN